MQTSERSGLEQDLGQTVSLVKAKRAVEGGQAEAQLYSGDLYNMAVVVPGQSLPAPTVSCSCIVFFGKVGAVTCRLPATDSATGQ